MLALGKMKKTSSVMACSICIVFPAVLISCFQHANDIIQSLINPLKNHDRDPLSHSIPALDRSRTPDPNVTPVQVSMYDIHLPADISQLPGGHYASRARSMYGRL
jgi:hypothetical protein